MSEADLRAYYEDEAADRDQRPLDPRRDGARTDFIALLGTEGRRSVLEIGCGPGRDGAAFAAAGLDWAGIDLAQNHVDLCTVKGLSATRGSVQQLPFPDGSFEAGWTMSTLMHLGDADLVSALCELVRVLRPGAPLAVGLWGATADEHTVSDLDRVRRPQVPPRFFARRSDATVRRLFGRIGTIERFLRWPAAQDWHYQWFIVRLGEASVGR